MFIQTEQTPNPATLKFLPGRDVMVSGTADFPTAEAARRSPLAERLFGIEGVAGIFFGSDFITVTKTADKDWHLMKPAILGAIMEHFTAGKPIIVESATPAGDEAGEDSDIVSQIKELIDTRVLRPSPRMAAISSSTVSPMVSSICTCRARARAARARPRPSSPGSRTCSGTTSRKCKRFVRSRPPFPAGSDLK